MNYPAYDIDNCPDNYNPDQINSDAQGGGDVCDLCPNDEEDVCNINNSGGAYVAPEGGTVSNNDDSVTIELPTGALDTGSSIGITSQPNKVGTNFVIGANMGKAIAFYEFTPTGITFAVPVTVTMVATCTKNCDKLSIWVNTEGVGWEKLDPTICEYLGSDVYECSAETTPFTPFALFVPADSDDDGISDSWDGEKDNCPNLSNADQEDTYPPSGNGIGDACECEGNFNCSVDQDVDGSDASSFKQDFGRSGILHPCVAGDLCNGDFLCDGDVDGTDASKFKTDFGRGLFNRPCPKCEAGVEWCQY